ncbi:MAG TPA: DUF2252 family protein [Streptosporangiaceae bacterium]
MPSSAHSAPAQSSSVLIVLRPTSGAPAAPERNLSFDLRDFDETLPGPFE